MGWFESIFLEIHQNFTWKYTLEILDILGIKFEKNHGADREIFDGFIFM